MSTAKTPMELIDRYLQAVRFWLPRTRRQEEVIAELGEDLRSQIEEKEVAAGRPAEQAEVSEILKRCGSPMVVAGRLGPQRYLIGPMLFPIYEFVLKMVLLWILLPVYAFIVGLVNLANAGGDWGLAIVNTMSGAWFGMFIAAGTITLVFAVIERTSAHLGIDAKWDPLKLPPVRKEGSKQPSRLKSVCELGFSVFGMMWLLLVPNHPFLILGPAAAFLKLAPITHTFFWPIVALWAFGLLRPIITLARPQWGWFPPVSQLAQTALSLVMLRFIINAAGHLTGANTQPFVMVVAGLSDAGHLARVAAIVNVMVLVSLAATWFGMCIGGVVQTWELLRYVRNRNSGIDQAATLNV